MHLDTSLVRVAYPDERFPPAYGRLFARLEGRGERISAMDLLIATAAVVEEGPLVIRNVKDFARVTGLRLLGYRRYCLFLTVSDSALS